MNAWICFAAKKGSGYCKVRHMVFRSPRRVQVLCGQNQLLGRRHEGQTLGDGRLCRNCLVKLAWRGRVGW